MATKEQVKQWLNQLRDKQRIGARIIFRDDRPKNAQTLLALELRPAEKEKIINELKVEDYCEGPLEDALNGGTDMWVFGKTVKGKELYIKITLGEPRSNIICISFHEAERKLDYPLKS